MILRCLDRDPSRRPASALAAAAALPGGDPLAAEFMAGIDALSGLTATLGIMFDGALNGLFAAVFLVLGYVRPRLLLRRTLFANLAALLLLTVVQAPQVLTTSTAWWITAGFQAVIIIGVTVLVVRYGLLVTAVALIIINMIGNIPIALLPMRWSATTSNLVIAAVLGIAVFGFYASRASQPLFREL